MLKFFINKSWFRNIICWLIAKYLYLVYITSRWDIKNLELLCEMQANGAFIPIMWHNRIAMPIFAWGNEKALLTILVSGHKDGIFVSKSLGNLGANSISIPPKTSAAGAIKRMVKLLKSGNPIVITPDGPRGPRFIMKNGAIIASKLSKAPIILVTYSISRRKIINSWDKFIGPLPFAKGIIAFSKVQQLPIKADAKAITEYQVLLEKELVNFTNKIDQELGLLPIAAASMAENAKIKIKKIARRAAK